MSIENGESGASVRGKLNGLIDTSSLDGLLRRYGYAGQVRNTLSVASRLDRDKLGSSGPGNPNQFPNIITASQSGTTITASSADFRRIDAGMMIYWDTGEFARIIDVDTTLAAVTTCVADRSQTVDSGSARVDVKPFVICYQGDSLGTRVELGLKSELPRSFGWGGYIYNPATGDSFSEVIRYAGGAAVQNTSDEWGVFPTGSYWSVPLGGSVEFGPFGYYANGVARPQLYGLNPEDQKHDTFYVVWKRAAGAFRIERKRAYDPEWVVAETVADASIGSTTYGHRRVSHTEGYDWQYRIVSTSGTIKIAYAGYINEGNPGYVRWDISRGSLGDSKDLKRFSDTFPSDALTELCRIFNPDMRITLTADPNVVAGDLDCIAESTAMWDTASGRIDHVWIERWNALDISTDVQDLTDYNTEVRAFAVANGHTFLPTLDLFDDYETSIRPLNLLDDTIHPGRVGSFILTKQFLQITGLKDLPSAKSSKKIDSETADISTLRIRGRDVRAQLDQAMRRVGTARPRGAVWSDEDGFLRNDNGISSAIGTGDFTFQWTGKLKEVSLATSGAVLLKIDGDSSSAVVQDGGIRIGIESRFLRIRMNDASGNKIIYQYEYFPLAHEEEEGTLTIRSDVANSRFDIFWNGEPAISAEKNLISGDTTSPLGTWSGTGSGVQVALGPDAARTIRYVKGIGFWKSRLTDSEIKTNAFTQWFETTPEFFWAFDEGAGRAAFDQSGNGHTGIWLFGGATPLRAKGPVWLNPLRGELAPVAPINISSALFTLFPGDNILWQGVTLNATRKWDIDGETPPKVGDVIKFTNAVDVTTHNVRIGQPALHQIKSGSSATTIGTGGYIQFADAASSVTLTCSRADAGVAYEWILTNREGGTLSFT